MAPVLLAWVDGVTGTLGRITEGRGSVTQWSRAQILVTDFLPPNSAISKLCDLGYVT